MDFPHAERSETWYTLGVKFVDELLIEVTSGKGGDGMIAFRREKFVPLGGPSGGDGGDGGDVVLVASHDVNTLYDLSFNRIIEAKAGEKGGPKDMFGAGSPDSEIKVPVGTLVFEAETGEQVGDLDQEGSRLIVARGGRGGKGNAKFVSSVRRAPRIAEKGEPGEHRRLRLELKLLADVGLVGLPNAGKSTFLSVCSNARPKIADYPFTTLVPSLGIVKVDRSPSFCMADLPGLIEGAHQGAGLGIQFLKHIERTRVLIHLVDLSELPTRGMLKSFDTILEELESFNPDLIKRPMLVVGNKLDLPHAREIWPKFEAAVKKRGYKVFPLSGATKEGLKPLLREVIRFLAKAAVPEKTFEAQAREHRFVPAFEIEQVGRAMWQVRGREIERLVGMTDFTTDEGVALFLRRLTKMGFIHELEKLKADSEDTIAIGEMEFEYREFFR